ncbi:MAG TPA: peptidylprolyl isomerase [Phycisphaerales bacterium]|nr:peptidylprolyl isomerase [Phycisphaerales bacterium]
MDRHSSRAAFAPLGKLALSLVLAGSLMGVAPAAFADEPSKEKPAQTEPGKSEPGKSEPAKSEPAKPEPAKPDAKNEKDPKTEASKEQEVAKVYYVKMSTSQGDIVIELDNEHAPISTKNFLSYVDKKHYDGTIFHRVIPGFMIQGGNFLPNMSEKKTDAPIKNEWQNGLKNTRGTLAMARTAVADSATSQFFINVADNNFLDQPRDGAAYAVFGRVVSGMDVVDKIVGVPTVSKGPHKDVPRDPVTINSVTRLTEEEAKSAMASGGGKEEAAEPAKK